MLDRYVWGTVSRISPEAPVPVVHVTRDDMLPGGAANVARNICSLGGHAVVAGLAGADMAADDLERLLGAEGIGTGGIHRDATYQTPVKTRIVAERQQVVRVDREGTPDLPGGVIRAFCERLDALLDGVDGVVIEDYGKGTITQEVVDRVLRKAKQNGLIVGLDPKDNHELDVHGVTLATPNDSEAFSAAGFPPRVSSVPARQDPRLAETGKILLNKWGPALLMITLGAQGMYILGKGDEPMVIPTRAQEVFDVSGAGDTVIGTATLALTAGAAHREAASLANEAAGVVVGKLGTATCTPDELLRAVGEHV
jgi:D-beta-D-heptose 7-phosphate kinase/D-beta-D-heptose 1-phosphate adenosyltransferase